jgi:L-threonylcarbamoyladenylate synthase
MIVSMSENNMWSNKNLVKVLNNGGVVVMPTDTLYGIVGKIESEQVVNRIYEIRKRAPNKPCIILISSIKDLEKFSIILSEKQKEVLEKYWLKNTEPLSIILDCLNDKFTYLHRGTNSLAFRLPAQKDLRNLLKETGPLIAPSANPEGLPPALNITEAKKYFGNSVDLYIDGGEIKGKASKVIRLKKDGSVEVLRD